MRIEKNLPIILAVGGLDPTGAAGILMDALAARSVGAHAAAVLTVDTLQDGERFLSARAKDGATVRAAVEAMLQSLSIGAIKTGALGTAEIVEVVADLAERPGMPPLVLDPVIASTSGGALLDEDGVRVLRNRLLGRVALVTPNLAEAEILTGGRVEDISGMRRAAARLVELGAGAALVKGGHLEGRKIADVFFDRLGREKVFEADRSGDYEVRGTGCALASMIAGLLAWGRDLLYAATEARAKLSRAIIEAVEIGPGPRVLGLFTSAEMVQSNEHGSD